MDSSNKRNGNRRTPGSNPKVQTSRGYNNQNPQTYDRRQYGKSSSNSQARGPEHKEGSSFSIKTNYLVLELNLERAYQYCVEMTREEGRTLPKKFYRLAFEEFRSKVFPQIQFAYDGQASCYTTNMLDQMLLKPTPVTITPAIGRPMDVTVIVSETKDLEIDMTELKSYPTNSKIQKDMRALQCLEVVLAQCCHEKGTRSGSSFYFKSPDSKSLSNEYDLWCGLFQSIVLGEKILLNIDVSHKAFTKETTVLDYLKSFPRKGPTFYDNTILNNLKNKNLIYNPPKSFGGYSKTFKLFTLGKTPDKEVFELTENGEQKRTNVLDYYKSKGYRIEFPQHKLLKTNYDVCFPMELCTIEGGITEHNTPERVAPQIIKYSATNTKERQEKIMKLLEYFHGLRSPIIENFGISFKHEFIKIEGRRLVAPILTYEGSKTKSVFNGKWSMGNSKFLEAPTPTKMNWAFLNLDSTINEPTSKKCASELVEIAKNQGLYLNDNPIYMISKESIDNDLKEIKSKNCKFALIILPDNGEFTYWKIKQVAELEAGVVTQVITSNTIKNRWVASTINHVLLKLNSKLNGINHKISPESNVQLIYKNYVMFVGADVTHPTPQDKGTPSVVGVVSSTDNSGCKYNMGHSYQKGRKEIIDDFKNIMIKHIRLYAKKNKGIPPTHIIYYRDGIDDGQFDLVINEELNKGMNQAFGEIAIQIKKPYNPKVTCIVVQKRNHTRFFPLEGGPSFGKMMNVFPGTVVDKVICHPKRKEFFLVSHESGLGTVKPTKYIVIRDDSNISMDDIHKITHNMCHLFPRCNREVSYPAPAYLAHHAASRGKAYIQDLKNFDLDDLNKNTIVSEDIMENNPMFFI